MLRPRTNHSSATLNGEIYVIGGKKTNQFPNGCFRQSCLCRFPCGTGHFYAIIRHCIFVSLTGTTMDFVEVEHYDPFSNCWTPTRPALKYVTNFTATSCEGKLYLIGSCAVKYNALTMQCYNPVIGKKQHLSTCIMSQVSVKTNHICHIRASSGLELAIQNNFMRHFTRVFTHGALPTLKHSSIICSQSILF